MDASSRAKLSTLVSPLPDMTREPRFRVAVASVSNLSADILCLKLKTPGNFHFKAGQYVWIVLPERSAHPGAVDRRAYSISSPPDHDLLEFIIRRTDSEYVQAIFALSPGDDVDIIGPMGSEFIPSSNGAVMIAGGVGVSPFLSILRSDLSGRFSLAFFSNPDRPVHCEEQVLALANDQKKIVSFSGAPVEESLKEFIQVGDTRPIFVSGPQGFVNAVADILNNAGVSDSRIHYEAFHPLRATDIEISEIFQSVDNNGRVVKDADQEGLHDEHERAHSERMARWKRFDIVLTKGFLILSVILSLGIVFIESIVRDEYLWVSVGFFIAFIVLLIISVVTRYARTVNQWLVALVCLALVFVRLDEDTAEYSGAWLVTFPIVSTVFFTPRVSLIWNTILIGILGVISIIQTLGMNIYGLTIPHLHDAEQYLFAATFVLIVTQIFSRKQEIYEEELQREMIDQRSMIKLKERTYRLNEIFTQISEQTSNHVIFTDSNGRILYANRAAERLTGYTFREMRGQTPRLWGGLMPPAEYRELWRRKEHGNIVTHEILNRRRNGELYTALGHITPLMRDGKVFAYVATEEDITPMKEVDKAKTEFVSLASHQLRTPLSAINWYAEMLLAGDAGGVNEEQKKYLDEIYRGNQRMVELVNALLDVSRLELGTFSVEPKPTDVIELARSVIQEQLPQIHERQQQFLDHIAGDIPEMSVDPKLLRMVFQNLLSNAVKYTPKGGKVSFELSADKGKQELSFCVKDTGIGIPKDQQERIFNKLFRADNVKETDTDGTGLGLYIVNSIVQNADGRVWFESEEGKGTTFFVTLPLSGMKEKSGTKRLSS